MQGQDKNAHDSSVPGGPGGSPLDPPRRVVLGVTGSIAAYKAPLIVRELNGLGIEVKVVMTPAAKKFVSKLVLANLSGHPVIASPWEDALGPERSWHVQLAHWAQAMLIAPCTASTLGRLVQGIYDNAVTLVASSLLPETPLLLAPSMDHEMWEQPAVQNNVRILQERGAGLLGPTFGPLASGRVGQGRLWEPAQIARATQMTRPGLEGLRGKRILLDSGPTREAIDSVRYLSNASTGKMGLALADQALCAGAQVTLVSGPVHDQPLPGVELVSVESAREMRDAMLQRTGDIVVAAAAVADFSPKQVAAGKLDRRALGEELQLSLQTNPDILRELGARKGSEFLVGFALETGDGVPRALKKLREKNCDMVVLNWADRAESGPGGTKNTVTLVWPDETVTELGALSKEDCAYAVWRAITSSWSPGIRP